MSAQPATSPERLTHDRARDLFTRFYELLNERDPARIPEVFTDDILFEDDAWPETVRGHSDMERFLRAIWRAFPDFRFELIGGPYLAGDGGVAARVRVTGTMRGPLDPPGFAPTNRRISTEYGGFYELEGDRLSYGRIIVNMNDAATQLGALPPPGSTGERLAVQAQRLQARLARRRTG